MGGKKEQYRNLEKINQGSLSLKVMVVCFIIERE